MGSPRGSVKKRCDFVAIAAQQAVWAPYIRGRRSAGPTQIDDHLFERGAWRTARATLQGEIGSGHLLEPLRQGGGRQTPQLVLQVPGLERWSARSFGGIGRAEARAP